MPLYTFYPYRPDGTSDTFVSLDLQDDQEAYARALDILDHHPSAAYVVGWCRERLALTRNRVPEDLGVVLGRDPQPSHPSPSRALNLTSSVVGLTP
jgi:hypothetical protein